MEGLLWRNIRLQFPPWLLCCRESVVVRHSRLSRTTQPNCVSWIKPVYIAEGICHRIWLKMLTQSGPYYVEQSSGETSYANQYEIEDYDGVFGTD